ncbi:MAG: hypothetical protein M1838_001045 [Thelocarpon superellum]|nr:MAG: hypothetical protein M1838_001045 [Thelocarpon superellum]
MTDHVFAGLAISKGTTPDLDAPTHLKLTDQWIHIGYANVSLVFVANASGYISAAFVTDAIRGRLGQAMTLMIAQTLLVAGFFGLGFGLAMGLALNNVFVANLANNMLMLGMFHGSYGIEERSRLSSQRPLSRTASARERTASQRSARDPSRVQVRQQALRNQITVLGALFIFAYQGAEVSISGWVISFLISYRNGNPADVGYVTAGFWRGITAGRFLLVDPARRIGEKSFVAAVVVASAAFQLLVWLVPNVIGDAVAVAIVGLLLGPVYPAATAVFTRHLGRRVQTSAIGFISAMGSSGGAFAPFATGLGSQLAGTWILHPVCVALYAGMEVTWFLLLRSRKRTEYV